MLRERGLAVRRADRTVATMDHSAPTTSPPRSLALLEGAAGAQLRTLAANCREFGVPAPRPRREHERHRPRHRPRARAHASRLHHRLRRQPHVDPRRVRRVRLRHRHERSGPRARHAVPLAAQAEDHAGPRRRRAPAFRRREGPRARPHRADRRGRRHRARDRVRRQRGPRALHERPHDPLQHVDRSRRARGHGGPRRGDLRLPPRPPPRPIRRRVGDAAVARWRVLASDDGARFDRTVTLDAASRLEPMVTFGTHPGMAIPVTGHVPAPRRSRRRGRPHARPRLRASSRRRRAPSRASAVNVVFIGSCTNSRIDDLPCRRRRAAPDARSPAACVPSSSPGSQAVKREAEAEGLDGVFRQAGAEWREPGSSMCIAMNGDRARPRAIRRQHEQPQFSGGRRRAGRPHLPRVAAHRRRVRRHRSHHRRPHARLTLDPLARQGRP